MALIRALNSAISGLAAQQTRIDIIGDNLANVDTTGFKSGRATFQTVLSQTMSFGTAPQGFLGGIDPKQLGLGVQIADTSKNFTQGNLKATGNPGDLAIEGDGFFVMLNENGSPVYTRDGSFSLNPANYLHSPTNGFIVQGWMADFDTFSVTTGGPVSNVEIPVGDLRIAQETDNVYLDGNLNGAGEIANSGSVLESEAFWDLNAASAATANTLLTDLGKSGGAIDFTLSAGDIIEISADKGNRSLPVYKFEISNLPPTTGNDDSGTTVGDLLDFINKALGVNDSGSDTYSGQITTGTLDMDGAGSDDTVTANGMTLKGRDLWAQGVRVGDYVRFTSGDSAGLIARVATLLSPTSPYGLPAIVGDTDITFSAPLDPTMPLPTDLTYFEFNEKAFTAIGTGNTAVVPGAQDDPDSAAGVIRIAGNAGLANALSNIELTAADQQLTTFNQIKAATGESIVSNVTVFDSLGTGHTVEMTYVLQSKNTNGNTFKWFAETTDNSDFSRLAGTGEVNFDPNGQFQSSNPGAAVSLNLADTGANSPLLVSTDFAKVTGFANQTSEVAMVNQDGYEQGTLSDFSVSTNGLITGFFTNGLTKTLGQVALARFANNNGLESLGNNLYAAGTNSGLANVGTPGTFARGLIRSGYLEESNVDIAKEFTNLIVSQRAFQANARTISVANEMLQDLVNIV